MAPFLDGEWVEAAFDYVLTLDEKSASDYVSKALMKLSPRMTGALAVRAVPVILQRPQSFEQVTALVALAGNLPAEQGREVGRRAVDIALAIGGGSLGARSADLVVTPHVSSAERRQLIDDAVTVVLGVIYNDQMRVESLATLAPLVDVDARPKLLKEAVTWAFRIDNKLRRSELFARVAAQLGPDLFQWAIDGARGVEAVATRASLLADLLPFANPADAGALTAEIRGLIVEATRLFGTAQRSDLLEFLDTPSLFAPPIVPIDEADTIARRLAELRTEWRWR
jgi:hypothetical protein